MKAHRLLQRDGRRYAYRVTHNGNQAALLFVLFYKRVCGPLANSLSTRRLGQQPSPTSRERELLRSEAQQSNGLGHQNPRRGSLYYRGVSLRLEDLRDRRDEVSPSKSSRRLLKRIARIIGTGYRGVLAR